MDQSTLPKGFLKPTKKGTRFDLRVYVYPDGHGNVGPFPVNNIAEAIDTFKALWEVATERLDQETTP